MNSFELLLYRSVHNNDNKGLGSIRNIDSLLSELNIAGNINIMSTHQQHSNFKHGYNLGKESIAEKELIFISKDINNEYIEKTFMGDLAALEDDIADSREVEFMRAEFDEKTKCINMTLRNAMNYPVQLDQDAEDTNMRSYKLYKQSLNIHSEEYINFKANESATILTDLKPKYQVYDDLYSPDHGGCEESSLCLGPYELANMQMCLIFRSALDREV